MLLQFVRDVGLDQLMAPGGLEHLITQIKAHVFPRAQEEAKELFCAGQRIGGPLARQSLEPMLSYTQRRRRWWKTLIELDPSMQLSDSLRMELMLELSGLSRQEGLVVRACAATTDFEGVAKVLYLSNNMDRYIFVRDHDPGQDVHLHTHHRESRVDRALERGSTHLLQERVRTHVQLTPPTTMGRTLMSNIGMNIGMMNKLRMRMNPTLVSFVKFKMTQTAGEDDYDYYDDVDKYETMALNCLLDVEDADERKAGDAFRCNWQLIVMQLWQSQRQVWSKRQTRQGQFGSLPPYTIEQRRAKLADVKKRSKRMHCGAIGHGAGDPACKFLGSRGPHAQKNSTAKRLPTLPT